MRTEVITARTRTIDGAVEQILEELKEDIGGTRSGRRHNVIYFDGWDGLGASAVLREVGRRLAPAASSGDKKPTLAAGLEFAQIIHIDCSKWESRRALQKALVEQLKLPSLEKVKAVFDAQDEEDDYNGVGKGSRAEISQVAGEIYEHVQKQLGQRFLVIFNNGSCEEIDLESFGFPLSGYSRNKVLWSFQGRFRLYPRRKLDMALELKTASSTDVFFSATSSTLSEYLFSEILHHEAEEIVKGMISTGGIDWPTAAVDGFLYTMRLCGMGGHLIDYNLATHGCNYWICDDIIQMKQGDVVGIDDAAAETLWRSCDALKHEMRLDADYHQSPQLPASPVVRRLQERMAYWTSPTYGSTVIKDQHGRIPKGMFQQYDKLCVLKLSACTFSLTSPPFVCCQSLRFLWLDRCQEESSGAGNEEVVRQCFQKLWVLDVRYSSSEFLSEKMMDFMTQLRELHVMGQGFDMDMLQGRLHNIRKLRVTKSNTNGNKGTYLLSGKDKMEHLELSGNGGSMKSLCVESSSCSSLETVIIDGCVSLEDISLKGWARPKNLLLSGSFPDLRSLDLTGAAVKTLDLSAVMAPELDELLLLDCVKLTAILWPKAAAAGEGKGSGKRYLGKLRIDTTQQECRRNTNTCTAAIEGGSPAVEFDWYISARDTRILGSLAPVKDYFSLNDAHVVISTTPSPADAASGNKGITSRSRQGSQQHKDSSIYADVIANFKDTSMHQQASGGDDFDAWAIMCTCPPPPTPRPHPSDTQLPFFPEKNMLSCDCSMHIEDEMTRTTLQISSGITVPGFICDGTKALHVHDSMSISGISATPLGSNWNKLEWCRVERCPKLECVFRGELFDAGAFDRLRTIWASRLPNARYILWGSGLLLMPRAFKDLTLLHLYCCPRLAYAFPLTKMERLETLEIMWCGDLTVVFTDTNSSFVHETKLALKRRRIAQLLQQHAQLLQQHGPQQLPLQNLKGGPTHPDDIFGVSFPYLKHIHLHELPKLHVIFHGLIFTPSLETLKIRGCWSLRTLPTVNANNTVECDCEKEWWDRLQWGSSVQPRHYMPTHSRYYKRRMLRGSPLR